MYLIAINVAIYRELDFQAVRFRIGILTLCSVPIALLLTKCRVALLKDHFPTILGFRSTTIRPDVVSHCAFFHEALALIMGIVCNGVRNIGAF